MSQVAITYQYNSHRIEMAQINQKLPHNWQLTKIAELQEINIDMPQKWQQSTNISIIEYKTNRNLP